MRGSRLPKIERDFEPPFEHGAVAFADQVNEHHAVVKTNKALRHASFGVPFDPVMDLLRRVGVSQPSLNATGFEGHTCWCPSPLLKEATDAAQGFIAEQGQPRT